MELVDSYLNAVGQFLPADARQDILAELRDALEEEIGDAAAQRGADQPNAADAEFVLQRFGHPLKVASQYQPNQYLIGPDMYPAYVQTLRMLITLAVVGLVAVGLVLAMAEDWQLGFWSLVELSIAVPLWIVVIVTAVFAGIEYSGEKLGWYENWRPQALASGSFGVIDRSAVITNLVTEGVFLLWWNSVLVLPSSIPSDDGELVFGLAPVWGDFLWPLNVLIGACLLLHLYVLIKGVWQRPTLVLEIAANTALIAVLATLVLTPELVVVPDALSDSVAVHVNRTVRLVLVVIAGFCAWDIWVAFRHFRGRSWSRKPARAR